MPKKNHNPDEPVDISIALRALIETGAVSTHEDICMALEKQGYTVSQSKISRLLHKIAAIKITDDQGRAAYRLPHEFRLAHELTERSTQSSISQLIIAVSSSDVMIVVHTNPGAASLVARILDQEKQKLEILGCVAGDDTIFVAPKTSTNIVQVLQKINQLFVI